MLTETWLGYPPGEYSATRGYGSDAVAAASEALAARGWLVDGRLSGRGRHARAAIEEATDRSQDALVAALGEGIDDVIECCAAISAEVIAARSFPHDPRKRAAG